MARPAPSPNKAELLAGIRTELSARVQLLKRQEAEVARLRIQREKELRTVATIDASRQ
jgi:hypothetical protein